jgi:hypothetical protein
MYVDGKSRGYWGTEMVDVAAIGTSLPDFVRDISTI